MQIGSLVRRYAALGWRSRWKALLLSWVVCLGGWTAVYLLPSSYEASSRIYADADAVLGQLLRGIAIDAAPANQVELLQRTLLSRPNLERVIARTDLDMRVSTLAERDALLQELAKDIRISAQTRNLFTISYADRDARLARDVVQTVLNIFIEQASVSDRQQMDNARTFVNQQITNYETQLREAEQRRAEFRTRYIDLLPSDALGGITRLEQARARVLQLRGELEDVRRRRDLLRQQLEAAPAVLPDAAAPGGGGGGGGETRLMEAERQLRELRLRYTDQHPDVVSLRSVIAELRASGAGSAPAGGAPRTAAPAAPRQAGRVVNPLHEQLRLRLVDADATLSSLERQVRDEQAEVDRLETIARNAPQLQAQFQNLDRDYNILLKSYEELLQRRESVQIAGAARVGAERVRLEVVDPPTVPVRPSKPNRPLLASAVLVLGLGAGVGLALLLAQADRGFYTLHDLRRVGLPVLGGISPAQAPPRRAFPAFAFGGGVALLLLTFGAVLAGGPHLVARLPELMARLMA